MLGRTLSRQSVVLALLWVSFGFYIFIFWNVSVIQTDIFNRSHELLWSQVNNEVEKSRGTTFVTALYDIKRANWKQWQRSYSDYIDYFSNVLNLQSNLVIFCDHPAWELLRFNQAFLLHSNISLHLIPFSELEYSKYYDSVNKTMNSPSFKEDNNMLNHPESFSPEYIVLMSNKLSFMKKATELNPFKTSHFFWLDAGYGHGNKSHFPLSKYSHWEPKKLLNLTNVITYITLYKNPYAFKGYEKQIYKMRVGPILNGAFFGGDAASIIEYYHLYGSVFRKFLYSYNIVDDDQSMAIFCFYQRPKLFNLVYGGWNDVIKMFS